MNDGNGYPRIIPVGAEPPPMHRDQDRPAPARGQNKAKGKPRRGKPGNRFAVLNAFVDFTVADLARNEIAVWLVLYRDTRDGTARTSQADIGRRIGVSGRTVRRAMDRLRRRGLLKVTFRGGIGRGASAYRIRPIPPE